MLTIGIDIGTTTISAAVLEYQEEVKGKIEKKLLASKTVSNDSFVPTERKWERVQNPAVFHDNPSFKCAFHLYIRKKR